MIFVFPYPETNRRVVDIEWEACPLAGSTTIRFFLEALETYIEQRARGLHRVVGAPPPIAFSIRVCFSLPSRSRVLPQIR